jgi:membrane-bound lytic murein transglycosylase
MLQSRAMLANLNISQWTARKHDKSASAEVEKNHGAKDAGRFNKLLIDKSALEPINKIASAAREYHYQLTLPWGDNGDRLLSAKLYFEYTQNIRMYRDEFNQRVNLFCQNYPALIQAARTRLGTLYHPDDYPHTDDIRSRFSMQNFFTPVPDANDFRVDVGTEHIAKIRQDLEQAMQERQKQAIKECYSRVREVVERMHERLSDPEAIFKNSLIENARELIKILPGLNITEDPELEAVRQEVEDMLLQPDVLRTNKRKRAEVAKKASEVLAKLPWA